LEQSRTPQRVRARHVLQNIPASMKARRFPSTPAMGNRPQLPGLHPQLLRTLPTQRTGSCYVKLWQRSRSCLLCQMRRKLKQLQQQQQQQHPIHPPWTSRIGVRLPTAELIAQTGAFALRGEASGANSRKEGGEVAPPPGFGESQAQCTIKTQRRGSRWVLALRGVT